MRSINADSVMNEVARVIHSKLNDIGLLFRIFSRTKNVNSINRKLNSDPSYGVKKKLQDLIGIRVVLYFNDDIDTVRTIVSRIFKEKSKDASVDHFKNDEFKAIRYNIVYELEPEFVKTLNLGEYSHKIDNTFELQIRTIFSDRSLLILEINEKGFYYPITLDNIIYFSNIIKVKDTRIMDITPITMKNDIYLL